MVENPLGEGIEFLSEVQRMGGVGSVSNSTSQIGHFSQKYASFLANRRNRFDSRLIGLSQSIAC